MSLAWLLASGFGLGRVPVSPGSAGSLLALLLGVPLMLIPGGLAIGALVASLVGLWAIRAAGGEDDAGWVVIDEVAGQWLTLLGLAQPTLVGLAAAFVVFRFVDIAKPGPVGWADRQKGAAGVMADDLIAGAISAGILWAVRSRWPGMLG